MSLLLVTCQRQIAFGGRVLRRLVTTTNHCHVHKSQVTSTLYRKRSLASFSSFAENLWKEENKDDSRIYTQVYASSLQSPESYRLEYLSKLEKMQEKRKKQSLVISQEDLQEQDRLQDLRTMAHGIAPPLEDLTPITLQEMVERIHWIHQDRVLFLETCHDPEKLEKGTSVANVLVQDSNSDIMLLSLHNFLHPKRDDPHEILPLGTYLAFLAPVMVANDSQPLILRCDNPQCIVLFDSKEAWDAARNGPKDLPFGETLDANELLSMGNHALAKRKYYRAARFYDRVAKHPIPLTKTKDQITFLLNSAQVALQQEQWEKAERHYQAVLEKDASNVQGLLGLARAQLQIDKASEALELLQGNLKTLKSKNKTVDDPTTKQLINDCKRVLNEQEGTFDLSLLSEEVARGKKSLHGNYISPKVAMGINVPMAAGGDSSAFYRGSQAIEDIEENEILTLSKALVFATSDARFFYTDKDKNTENHTNLINLSIQQLSARPEMGRLLYDLEGGLETPLNDDSSRIDIPRIQSIVLNNSFQCHDQTRCAQVVWEKMKREQQTGTDVTKDELAKLRQTVDPNYRNSGVWYQESMVNHSCAPNVGWTNIGEYIIMRSTRPIAAGEELAVSYVGMEANFEERTNMFQNWTQPGAGFACQCPVCTALRVHPELHKVDRVVQATVKKMESFNYAPDELLKRSSRHQMLEVLEDFEPRIQHQSAAHLWSMEASSLKEIGNDEGALKAFEKVAEINLAIRGNWGMERLTDLWNLAGACLACDETEQAKNYLRTACNSIEFSGFSNSVEGRNAFSVMSYMNGMSGFITVKGSYQSNEEMMHRSMAKMSELAQDVFDEEAAKKTKASKKTTKKPKTNDKNRSHYGRKRQSRN